ncbi:MAG: sulfatase [Acidimicrobiales bacterium]
MRVRGAKAGRPGRSTRPPVAVAVLLAVAALAAGLAACSSGGPDTSRVDAQGRRRPNVLVVMTDDQTLESMRVMPITGRQLVAEGTSFTNFYDSFPNCCPSRATYLTGQYAHNTGVEDNLPPLGGYAKLRSDETLPVWLQRAGYWTASVGKYLNTWGQSGDIAPPPGWNRWFGLIDPTTYQYYGYSVSVDGQRRDYGQAPEDYQTDVLGQEVVDTIRGRAGQDQPWFVSFTPLSPHAEKPETSQTEQTENDGQFRWAFPKPAPRHERSLVAKAPRGPAFDDANLGKPPALQAKPALTDGVQKLIDQGYQLELETLQATDEWVGRIMDTLRETGQLEDTVVVFTSDNGFFHGEHRLAFVKYYLYEPAVHVPLVIRGGGFPKNKKVDQVAVNADLAPTILALTGAQAGGIEPDGRDLAPLARDPKVAADRGVLLENRSKGGAEHSEAIHTERYVYIETDGATSRELYDLEKDPDQLANLAGDPAVASLEAELARRLDKLRSCAGAACNEGPSG